MSLIDLAGQLLGGSQQGGGQNLLSEVMAMVNNHPGGLAGLVQSFQQGGLGDVVNSWVGTGQNMPISADQIQNVLGSGQLQSLASKLGISPGDAGSHLSQLLPAVIDQLTPNGQVEDAGSGGLLDMGMKVLKGFTG